MNDSQVAITASRYCDIPCYHAEWMAEQVRNDVICFREGDQLFELPFNPDTVLGPIFWTKNPLPFFKYLDLFKSFPYYFQFTITGYESDVEPGLPNKEKVIVPAFKRLADKIGPSRVVWRYDPILLGGRFDVNYHVERFGRLAEMLEGSVTECIIGFLADYLHVLESLDGIGASDNQPNLQRELASRLVKEASLHNIQLQSCSLEFDALNLGIEHAKCTDDKIFEQILGKKLKLDEYRTEAGCIAAIDIGWSEHCPSGCKYCFAKPHSEGI